MSNTQPIYCFNNSTMLKTSDMALMITALNTQLPAFCNAWNRPQYSCVAAPSSMPKFLAMSCAKAGLALPVKTMKSGLLGFDIVRLES